MRTGRPERMGKGRQDGQGITRVAGRAILILIRFIRLREIFVPLSTLRLEILEPASHASP